MLSFSAQMNDRGHGATRSMLHYIPHSSVANPLVRNFVNVLMLHQMPIEEVMTVMQSAPDSVLLGARAKRPMSAGDLLISRTSASKSCWSQSAVRAGPRLGLEKVIFLDYPARALRERIKVTVHAHLQSHPNATLQQLIDYVQQEHGVTLKPPAMCVIRQRLGIAPDNQQSRAARHRKH